MSRLAPKDTFKGLLFQSWMKQRMLVALAVHGPMRIQDAVDLSLATYPSSEQFDSFEATGLINRFGSERSRMIALNPAFPAIEELRILLRALTDHAIPPPRLPYSESHPTNKPVEHDHLDLFGYKFQTIAVLAVAYDGRMTVADLRQVLRKRGATTINIEGALAAVAKRQVLEVVGGSMLIHSQFRAKHELTSFIQSFTKILPDYRMTIPRDFAKEEPLPTVRYDWKEGPVGRRVAAGVQASTDRVPLLFGTVIRFRVLVALAMNGAMSPTDLIQNTKVSRHTLFTFKEEGLLVSAKVIENRQRSLYAINPGLPAYDELVQLARVLGTQWVPAGKQLASTIVPGMFTPKKWTPGLKRYFGSATRTETLLGLSALGQANVSSLCGSVKTHDRHEIERSLLMFRNYEIVKYVDEKEKRKRFELNPDWFAAMELAALLVTLRKLDTRHHFRELSRSISDEELLSG